MKIYECKIDTYTSTTLLADEIFMLSDEYTGIAFHTDVLYFTSKGIIEPILFAVFTPPQTFYSTGYSSYCTMTNFKKYLSSVTSFEEIKGKMDGLGFAFEIDLLLKKLSTDDSVLDIVKPFNQTYPIHIQRSNDYQTYGNYSKILYLTHYMLHKR